MKVKNVSSVGDLEVPALNWLVVKAGETVEVPDEIGAALLRQSDVWAAGSQKETNE